MIPFTLFDFYCNHCVEYPSLIWVLDRTDATGADARESGMAFTTTGIEQTEIWLDVYLEKQCNACRRFQRPSSGT
jgi:hypothetical protein